jgi:hypothetical protein
MKSEIIDLDMIVYLCQMIYINALEKLHLKKKIVFHIDEELLPVYLKKKKNDR